MIKLTEHEDYLLIELIDEEEFDLLTKKEFNDERHYLLEMLESGGYLGNNWDVLFDIGLTEAPAIGYGSSYDDNGEIYYVEKLWVYADYQLKDYLQELKINKQIKYVKV